MNKMRQRDILLLALPAIGLAALGFGLHGGNPSPAIEKVEVALLPPDRMRGEYRKSEDGRTYVQDTAITVFVKHKSLPFYTRYWGWKADRALSYELLKRSFFDQQGREIRREIPCTEGGFYYRGNELFGVTYELSSAEFPKSIGRVTFKMEAELNDNAGNKWILPASGTLHP